jgi:ATP-dependent RNA helicase HelY
MAQANAAARHPVATCPDVRAHLRGLERAERLARDAERLERRVKGRTESLARQFDRVLRVLEAWAYVDGWSLTPAGQRLARLYHESDLLVVECLEQGVLNGLGVAELAALVSAFTYESRGTREATSWFPTSRLRERWIRVEQVAKELNRAEDEAGLPLTRGPDPGFMGAAYAWASGQDLGTVIEDEEISGGDFVRNVKQLMDLLRQLGDHAPDPDTASAARKGADQLFRGVVAASSVVST